MNDRIRIHLYREEQRRLAFRHGLQQIALRREAVGQGRQLVRELQQQLQPFGVRDGTELVGDLLQPGMEGNGRHGFSPRVMGTPTLFPHSVHDPS